MSEEGEYEEQNLDEFLKNVSNILIKKEDDRKDKIIQTINNHLLTIINDQTLMENFFSTISSIIFLPESNSQSSNSIRKKRNFNKEPFILYPIVYSFNPNITVNYIDYFLTALKHSISEENKTDFSFLSLVFSDIVSVFYNNNSNNDTLDNQEKEKLYEKLFDFINDNIKVNRKTERYMGCLLLAEFIEKCPLINEEKYLGPLFKEFSSYLNDRWFQCKLDLLNCILTLIYTVKKNFSHVCLFRILDYLTDSDWMKRKLTINIVYTLVYYCREQIVDVKENIIEFLNVIKKDDVEEVREMCLQTLKFIEESYPKNDKTPKENNYDKEVKINNNQIKNIINNLNDNIDTKFSPVITEEKKYEFSEDSLNNLDKNKNNFNSDFNNIFDNKNEYISKNNNYFDNGFYIYNLIKGKSKSKNSFNNSNNNNSSQSLKKNDKNNESGVFNKNTCSTRTLENQSNKTKLIKYNTNKNFGNNLNANKSYNNPNKKDMIEQKKLNKSTEQRAVKMDKKNNAKNGTKKLKKIDTNAELREKFNKEKLLLQEVEKQINERRSNQPKITSSGNQNTKKKTFKFSDSKNKNNKKNIYVNKINELPKENRNNINSKQQPESNDTDNDNTKYRESIDMVNSNNNNSNNLNQNENNNLDNKEEIIENSSNSQILEQLNKIQENQNNLMKMINSLKSTVDMNYFLLDKRIAKLESYHNINNNNNNLNENKQISNDFLYKNEQQNQIIDDEMKIEIIKNKYISGKYNEALNEAKQNDKYLYRLLPLIVSENIPKIDLSLIEEVISELSLKLPKLCMGEGKNNINIILSFFNQVIRSRINLKLIIQINLKDILQLMKTEYILKLSQNDITNIDIILRSLKV